VLVGSSAGLQCPQAYGELSLEPERHLAGRRFGQAKRSSVAVVQGRQRVVCDPAGLIRDAALILDQQWSANAVVPQWCSRRTPYRRHWFPGQSSATGPMLSASRRTEPGDVLDRQVDCQHDLHTVEIVLAGEHLSEGPQRGDPQREDRGRPAPPCRRIRTPAPRDVDILPAMNDQDSNRSPEGNVLRFALHRQGQNSQVSARCHGMPCRSSLLVLPNSVGLGYRPTD
jgi:hypothetical protein